MLAIVFQVPLCFNLACLVLVTGMPLHSKTGGTGEGSDGPDPISYLLKYGYVNQEVVTLRQPNGTAATASSASLLGPDSPEVVKAVRRFQDFAGLPVTGEVDQATLQTMAMPRCGVRDRQMPQIRRRRRLRRRFRRFAAHGSRWETLRLTYGVGRYPSSGSRLSRSDVDRAVDLAFRLWAWPRSPLSFSRSASAARADIRLDFFSGAHGRGDEPFDGRSGVLAHAFFPRFGGDVHFDDDEDWAVRRSHSRGGGDGGGADPKQLLQTAAHEIGHSLGLQHSKDRSSLMAPFYRGWMERVQLGSDDVAGIRNIYGQPKEEPTTTAISTTTSSPPVVNVGRKSLCEDPRIDAATKTADGSYYVFRGDLYWRLRSDGIVGVDGGYPRHVSDWSRIPGKVDAAFFDPSDGATYVFREDRVARFRNLQIEPGYPKLITEEFGGGAPDRDVDAALLWGGNGHLYLFRGDLYWKYNFAKGEVEHSYPRRVSQHWHGVPTPLGSSLRWRNGKSYFFDRAGNYYRFDDDALSVDRKAPVPFPRTVGRWWFGCDRREGSASKEGGVKEEEGEIDEGEEKKRTPRRWVWSG